MLIHLATEAVRTGTPVVDVEDSMTAFARALGVPTDGPHLKHLKDQLARLAAATVRMGLVEDGRAVQVNGQFVSALDLWYPSEPGQRVLWPSTVRLVGRGQPLDDCRGIRWANGSCLRPTSTAAAKAGVTAGSRL